MKLFHVQDPTDRSAEWAAIRLKTLRRRAKGALIGGDMSGRLDI